MPVSIVLDHPRRHVVRRLGRRMATVAGGILVAVALIASIAAVPSSVLVAGLALGFVAADETEPWPPPDMPIPEVLLVWGISTPIAVVGLRSGLRLLRRGRTLVLFLRRFGYDAATSAVTFAVTETIGRSWRLVTLDDAEIAPVGVPAGTRRLFRLGGGISSAVLKIGHLVGRAFPFLTMGMWVVVAVALAPPAMHWARTGDPKWQDWFSAVEPLLEILGDVMELRFPFEAIGPDLPGVFAMFAIAAAVAFIGLLVAFVALLAAFPLGAVLLFFSWSADAVRDAERSKTAEIRTAAEIRRAVSAVAARSRRVFGPGLAVLRVASAIWQDAVRQLASVSSIVLIDVSEPTEHLLWEIEELSTRFGPRCVLVGEHARVSTLAAPPGEGPASGALEARAARLLDGREVLAYTTDRRGMRRFASALHARLLERT